LAQRLFHELKFNGTRHGIGGATAQVALIIGAWAVGSQVNGRWKLGNGIRSRSSEKDVTGVRQITKPAISGDFVWHFLSSSALFETD
jgi:hypothetical protein